MLLPVRSAKTFGGSHNTQSMPHSVSLVPWCWPGGWLATGAGCSLRLARTIEDGTHGDTASSSPDLSHAAHGLCRYGDTCVDMCRYGDRYLCVGMQIFGQHVPVMARRLHFTQTSITLLPMTCIEILHGYYNISSIPSVLKIHSSNNLFCSKQLAASLHSSPLQFQRRALVIMVTIYLMIQIYLFNHSRTHVSRKYTRIFRGDTGLLTILNFVETKIGSVPLTSKLLWQKILFVIFQGKFYPHPPQKFILLLIF